MVEKPTVPSPMDPHAKIAKRGTGPFRDGDGTWTMSNGHIGNAKEHSTKSGYSDYLFGRSGESEKPLWSDSTKGRIAIRLISRGIAGALAMTVVDRWTRNSLQNYEYENFNWHGSPFWQKVAYGIDHTIGRGIQQIVRLAAPAGQADFMAQNATRFRYKAYYHDQPGMMPGRSLGAEMVGVTAGFSAASFGDATFRNLIQAIDPNATKSWMVNDKGELPAAGEKTHFDFGKWLSATLRTSWRIVSKNAGEDWAVALPYVYQMRWQRNLMGGERFPDSKLELDNHMNGASLHLDEHGNIIGDFQLAGSIDLHTRFVGYNWYTLMYRETYDAIGRRLQEWKDSGFALKMPALHNPISSALNAVGYAARYVVKSFIKANIYMNPAVLFFWPTRVAQGKWRASPIIAGQDPHLNAFAQTRPGTSSDVVDVNGSLRFRQNTTSGAFPQVNGPDHFYVEGRPDPVPAGLLQGEGVYSWGVNRELIRANPLKGAFSTAIAPFGWASYKAGSAAIQVADMLPQRVTAFMGHDALSKGTPIQNRNRFIRNFVDNSLAYTPYMIAKAETALRVDERPSDGSLGSMDRSIYKLIDSTVKFDFKNIKASLGEIWRDARDMGREVKMREGAVSPQPDETPATTVEAGDVKHVSPGAAVPLSRTDGGDDRNWAESVAGRDLQGRFQPASTSLH